MRKVKSSAVLDDSDSYPLETMDDSVEDVHTMAQTQKEKIILYNKKDLFVMNNSPQIDGNLSLGTLCYLQRHVFMIFIDVILVLNLSNSINTLYSTALSLEISILSYLGVFCPIYFSIIKCFWHLDVLYGNDNILYYVINGTRLVLYYGICYTGPSVYNSSGSNLLAFSIFLCAIRCLTLGFKGFMDYRCKRQSFKRVILMILLEMIPVSFYVAVAVLQSILKHRLDLIYLVWAVGVVFDFISLIVIDGLNLWDRSSVQLQDLSIIISKKAYTEQLSSDPFDRMKILTLTVFAWGGSQLFPTRYGVGMPDLFVSIDYNVKDFLVGMMGILTIFFLMRCYVAASTNSCIFKDDLKDCMSKRVNVLIGCQKLIHVLIHAILFLALNLLKRCIKDIWDNFNRFPGTGFYFDFGQITGYQFSLWRSLPYPTQDTFTNFLRPWVANQTNTGIPPPGLYSIPSFMSGTSLLHVNFTQPDTIFCCALGFLNLFLLFMHWTNRGIEFYQNSQDPEEESLPSLKSIFFTKNSIIKTVNATIFFAIGSVDVKYLDVLCKMIIITATTFLQVLWDDSQRISGYQRTFTGLAP